MPHLFVNRPRLHSLTRSANEYNFQFAWESLNAILYAVGGVAFIIGSIFFFPRFEAFSDVGAWIFFGGSILYLVVTGHDLLESIGYYRSQREWSLMNRLELAAAATYLIGTLLFCVGSVLFLSQVEQIIGAAWCFIVGSLLFVVGAFINVLQIVSASSLATLQLMNLTAISFVVGSVLFSVSSVPYLWTFKSELDQLKIFNFLAWQYLLGSCLFLAGGIFNYRRAYFDMQSRLRVHRNQSESQAAR